MLNVAHGSTKFFFTGVYLLVGIEQFGRRNSLMFGAALMGLFFFIIGAVIFTHPPNPAAPTISSASIAAATMIYLYVIPCGFLLLLVDAAVSLLLTNADTFSWGPCSWVYVSEIFPTSTRSAGVSLAAANQWLWNFVIAKITPFLIEKLPQGRLFLTFGSINLVMAVFAYYLPETRGV